MCRDHECRIRWSPPHNHSNGQTRASATAAVEGSITTRSGLRYKWTKDRRTKSAFKANSEGPSAANLLNWYVIENLVNPSSLDGHPLKKPSETQKKSADSKGRNFPSFKQITLFSNRFQLQYSESNANMYGKTIQKGSKVRRPPNLTLFGN